ncbi:MAG: transcription termination factor Rho, partial [Candidatus Bipolaricaulis sp.]
MSEVRSLGLEKLTELAQSLGVDGTGDLSSVEIELAVMRALAERQELVVEGILEIMPDGYGFLRERSCLPSRYDVYVSPSQIKRFGLK